MRCDTRSGCTIAYASATAEPPDMPRSANRPRPTASTTDSRSPRRASIEKSSTSQSDIPKPRSSYRTIVANAPRVVQEMPPDGALSVVLEVAQPAGGDDEGRPGPMDRVGQPRSVTRPAEADLLVDAGRAPFGS